MDTTGNPDTEQYLILAQELMRMVLSDKTGEEIRAWLHSRVGKLTIQTSEGAALEWMESLIYYDNLLATRKEKADLPDSERKDLIWAWPSWNKMIDPFEAGLLAILAAGDGMGKTIYAESQAEAWAKCGLKVAFVHFELNRAIMLDRRAARHSGLTRRELKNGPFNQALHDEWHRARNVLETYSGDVTYWHTPGWTMEQVTNALEPEIDNGRCDVIVIDYLEKAQGSLRQQKMFGANNWQREADDVEWIKTFAERTETPVFALAQMNKSGKMQGISGLDRTAIRGAGEKTEKANIVILLNRENTEDGYSNTVDVRIDKNTLGPTGTFAQYMQGANFRVADIVQDMSL